MNRCRRHFAVWAVVLIAIDSTLFLLGASPKQIVAATFGLPLTWYFVGWMRSL